MINTKKRRIISRALLPFVVVFLSVFPARESNALVPLLALGGAFLEADVAAAGVSASVAIAEAATGTSAGAIAAGAAAGTVIDTVTSGMVATIGMVVTYFAVHDSTGNIVRVPLVSNAVKGKIPAPYAPPTAPANTVYTWDPVAPNGVFSTTQFPTQAAACANVLARWQAAWPGYVWTAAPSLDLECSLTSYAIGYFPVIDWTSTDVVAALTPVPTCDPGYVPGAVDCDLTNARAAVVDHSLDFKRLASSYALPDSTDRDKPVDPFAGALYGNGTAVQIVGQDELGRTVLYEVIARPDGGATVKASRAVKNYLGTDGIRRRILEVNSTGVIESAVETYTGGSILVDSSTGPGASTASTVGFDAAAAPGGSTSGGAAATVTFPSDYARTGEAAAAANTVATKLDTLHNDLSATQTVADPAIPLVADMPGFGTSFNNLLGWSLPGHVSACPQPSMDLSMIFGAGHVYKMDAHCQLAQDHFSALNSAMSVVWTILALFIVLGA